MKGTYWSLGKLRDRADTIPAVTVLSNPKGLPIAATHSPTFNLLESPIFKTGRSLASILIMAMSVFLSEPRTLPLNSRLSVKRTINSSAPSTTCALVMMIPSGETINPDPVPRCSGISWGPPKLNGMPKRRKISAPRGSKPGMPIPSTVRALRIIWMLTTPGPFSSTSLTKSGSWTCWLLVELKKLACASEGENARELALATTRVKTAERTNFDANMLISWTKKRMVTVTESVLWTLFLIDWSHLLCEVSLVPIKLKL